jgi:transcriptional regulator with XRE-family HTH domain
MNYNEAAELLRELPRRVERARWRRGISQREAAKESGLSFSTFSRCESGRDLMLSSALVLLRWLNEQEARNADPSDRRRAPNPTFP